MKNFLITVFAILVSASSFAAEKMSCYKLSSPYDQKYSRVSVLWNGDVVEKVKVSLVNGTSIEDQQPEVSSIVIQPVCHGTLSGRYLCTTVKTVPLYKNFKNNLVKSIYFDFVTTGAIRLSEEAEAIKLKDVSCL